MANYIGNDAFHLQARVHPFMPVLRINKMLSCAGANRLQTSMKDAFWKSPGRLVQSGRSAFSSMPMETMHKRLSEGLNLNSLAGRRFSESEVGFYQVCAQLSYICMFCVPQSKF
uniref:Uncharacterized protein n=1 Tax=Populus trichocarpa TaxID=3694 RepID=A0A3N7EXB4_POPTR